LCHSTRNRHIHRHGLSDDHRVWAGRLDRDGHLYVVWRGDRHGLSHNHIVRDWHFGGVGDLALHRIGGIDGDGHAVLDRLLLGDLHRNGNAHIVWHVLLNWNSVGNRDRHFVVYLVVRSLGLVLSVERSSSSGFGFDILDVVDIDISSRRSNIIGLNDTIVEDDWVQVACISQSVASRNIEPGRLASIASIASGAGIIASGDSGVHWGGGICWDGRVRGGRVCCSGGGRIECGVRRGDGRKSRGGVCLSSVRSSGRCRVNSGSRSLGHGGRHSGRVSDGSSNRSGGSKVSSSDSVRRASTNILGVSGTLIVLITSDFVDGSFGSLHNLLIGSLRVDCARHADRDIVRCLDGNLSGHAHLHGLRHTHFVWLRNAHLHRVVDRHANLLHFLSGIRNGNPDSLRHIDRHSLWHFDWDRDGSLYGLDLGNSHVHDLDLWHGNLDGHVLNFDDRVRNWDSLFHHVGLDHRDRHCNGNLDSVRAGHSHRHLDWLWNSAHSVDNDVVRNRDCLLHSDFLGDNLGHTHSLHDLVRDRHLDRRIDLYLVGLGHADWLSDHNLVRDRDSHRNIHIHIDGLRNFDGHSHLNSVWHLNRDLHRDTDFVRSGYLDWDRNFDVVRLWDLNLHWHAHVVRLRDWDLDLHGNLVRNNHGHLHLHSNVVRLRHPDLHWHAHVVRLRDWNLDGYSHRIRLWDRYLDLYGNVVRLRNLNLHWHAHVVRLRDWDLDLHGNLVRNNHGYLDLYGNVVRLRDLNLHGHFDVVRLRDRNFDLHGNLVGNNHGHLDLYGNVVRLRNPDLHGDAHIVRLRDGNLDLHSHWVRNDLRNLHLHSHIVRLRNLDLHGDAHVVRLRNRNLDLHSHRDGNSHRHLNLHRHIVRLRNLNLHGHFDVVRLRDGNLDLHGNLVRNNHGHLYLHGNVVRLGHLDLHGDFDVVRLWDRNFDLHSHLIRNDHGHFYLHGDVVGLRDLDLHRDAHVIRLRDRDLDLHSHVVRNDHRHLDLHRHLVLSRNTNHYLIRAWDGNRNWNGHLHLSGHGHLYHHIVRPRDFDVHGLHLLDRDRHIDRLWDTYRDRHRDRNLYLLYFLHWNRHLHLGLDGHVDGVRNRSGNRNGNPNLNILGIFYSVRNRNLYRPRHLYLNGVRNRNLDGLVNLLSNSLLYNLNWNIIHSGIDFRVDNLDSSIADSALLGDRDVVLAHE
jgi:hypothetical protein